MRHELPTRHQLRDCHGLLGRRGAAQPLQLLLLGTSLELSYFVFQLPTGVLADLVSRRLCVLFDSGGQILGGPVVGAIGTLASVRIALLAGAAALGPAAACIAAASGRIRPVSGPDDEEEGVPIGNPV